MKKNVFVFGLILGAILCVNVIIMMNRVVANPDLKTNDVLGYAVMVVVFSLIFFGVRNYRNKRLDGFISFGKAFKAGALIALVGSTLYVVIGLGYYYLFVPEFIDKYIEHVLRYTPEANLAAKTKEMAGFKEMYKNPVFAILISYAEVLPIGLVIALISAFLLKKRKKLQTAAA